MEKVAAEILCTREEATRFGGMGSCIPLKHREKCLLRDLKSACGEVPNKMRNTGRIVLLSFMNAMFAILSRGILCQNSE